MISVAGIQQGLNKCNSFLSSTDEEDSYLEEKNDF